MQTYNFYTIAICSLKNGGGFNKCLSGTGGGGGGHWKVAWPNSIGLP